MTKSLREEEDSAAVEYGLILAFIAVVAVAGAQALGLSTNGLFNGIAGTLGSP